MGPQQGLLMLASCGTGLCLASLLLKWGLGGRVARQQQQLTGTSPGAAPLGSPALLKPGGLPTPPLPCHRCRQCLVFFREEDVHLKELLARWAMAFPFVLMCHLRESSDVQKEVMVSGGCA